MTKVNIRRQVQLPDPHRVELYRKSPRLGPRLLFFSGGSALRELSRELIEYTHNSIHIITPFDSGGSSAVLRKAFGMPAIGDVRNRIMALADQSLFGNPEIFSFFAHRLDKQGKPDDLQGELWRMAQGRHPLVQDIPDPMRKIVRNHLLSFIQRMPEDFNLRGASMGNLVLTAGYLENRRMMDPVIYIFSKLVEARGVVRPVVNLDMHLCVRLESGRTIQGQHLLTGKEFSPIDSPVADMHLCASLDDPAPVRPRIREKMVDLINEADVIVYPLGSFYSSLVANLLPAGVGEAIRDNPCPKVFVPNALPDPETPGVSVAGRVELLLDHLCRDSGVQPCDVLDFVLVDSRNGDYEDGIGSIEVERCGMNLVDVPFLDPATGLADAKALAEVLLSLA